MIEELIAHCEAYKGADFRRAVFQLVTTSILFFAAIAAMIFTAQQGYWLAYAALLLPTAGLLVRLFIIQHDCGHGSFFQSRKANDWVGRFLSLLTVTPYGFWRRTHNLHHAGSGNLDHRGYGGIETLTIEEYKALSPRKRFFYRLYRNPFLLLALGTPLFVIVGQRFAMTEPLTFIDLSSPKNLKGALESVLALNAAIIFFYGLAIMFAGAGPFLAVYLPVLIVTAQIGGWLFFIQHQFEDTTWDQAGDWKFREAALHGSSYYDLHPVLHWFTGNIGMHHIHHFCAMIPNYKLMECLKSSPELQNLNRITLKDSLKCTRLALWDEGRRKLVTFREAMA